MRTALLIAGKDLRLEFRTRTALLSAFVFAVLVNRKIRGIGLARIAFFYPTMLPMVDMA